jgi:hypothetical protein
MGGSFVLLLRWGVSLVFLFPFWSCWFATSWLYDVLVFYRSYKDALTAYEGAAQSSTPQVPTPDQWQQQQRDQQVQQTAGKAVKQFLQDLWSSFILIVSVLCPNVLPALKA